MTSLKAPITRTTLIDFWRVLSRRRVNVKCGLGLNAESIPLMDFYGPLGPIVPTFHLSPFIYLRLSWFFLVLIHADAMRNTCAILILLGAVCSVDAYHCKAESNQTRSARHEIRVCERRLAIQCNKQNRPSVADFEWFLKLFLDSFVFRWWFLISGKSNTPHKKVPFGLSSVNCKE